MITLKPIILVAALTGLSWPGPAAAQQSVRRVALDEALRLFAENNLELELARANAAEAAGLARQAAAYPNPTVTGTHERLSRDGASYSESYLNFSQRLEWPGARGARKESAEGSAQATRARLRADSARLAFEVKRAYVEAAAAEARFQTLRDVSAVFRTAESRGSVRFARGDLSGYDLRRLRIERARYENALAAAELETRAARRRLATLVLPEGEAVEIAPAEALEGEPPRLMLETALKTAPARRPEIAAAVAGVEAARAGGRLARRERLPDPTLIGGYKRQSDGFEGAYLGLSLPLPLFDRGDGEVAASDARVRAAEARLALTRRQIENDIRRAYDTYASLGHRAELVRGEILAQTGDLLEIAQVSYGEGAMALIELLDAADAFRDAELTTTDLLADYWVSYYDLERAVGGLPRGVPGEQP